MLEHLQPVNQRGPAPDGSCNVDRLGHLLEIGPLGQALVRVRLDAIRALNGVRDREGDQRLLANRQGALREDLAVLGDLCSRPGIDVETVLGEIDR